MTYRDRINKLPTSTPVRKRASGKWGFNNPTGEPSHSYDTKVKAAQARRNWKPWQTQFFTLGLVSKGDILTFQKFRSNTKEDVTIMGFEGRNILVKHEGKEKTLLQSQEDMGGRKGNINFKNFKLDKYGGITLDQLRRDVNIHCSSKEELTREQLILDLAETDTQKAPAPVSNLELSENNSGSVSESGDDNLHTYISVCLNLLGNQMPQLDRYHQIGKSLVELTSKTTVDN